jgi:hypothetical protein
VGSDGKILFHVRSITNDTEQGVSKLSVKDQVANILGFVGCITSVKVIHLYCYSMKADKDSV